MSNEEMLQAFWEQAVFVIETAEKAPPEARVTRAGAELELFLFHGDGQLASDEEKQSIADETGCGIELGASAVEIHPGPVDLGEIGFNGWLAQLEECETAVRKATALKGLKVGRCGTIPWASTKNVARTRAERYKIVPNFHNDRLPPDAPKDINGVFVGEAGVVGLLNAFQFSLEARSGPDALDKLNRLYQISPMAVALSANARVLDGKDTLWNDTRFEAWRRSHETRTEREIIAGIPLRIGLPANYFWSLRGYFQSIASYPFILNGHPEAALNIGVGLFWRDARIKWIEGKLVVEFRPVSTQPSLIEDVAIAAFVVGRLIWSQAKNEPLLPMALVQRNKRQAEEHGMTGILMDSEGRPDRANLGLRKELARAKEGLIGAKLLDEVASEGLSILEERIGRGYTPSLDQITNIVSTERLMQVVCKE